MEGGLSEDIGKIMEAVRRVYEREGDEAAAALLLGGTVELEVTNYDNWNGGTYTYAVKISVAPRRYAAYPSPHSLDDLEQNILQRIQRFARIYQNEFVDDVVILPQLGDDTARDEELISPPSFWRQGFLRLFISHVAKIKAEAADLAERLGEYGISAFVAHEHIEPTREWEDEIRIALATCDCLVALLTPDFPKSKWTDQEVGIAVGRGVLVIPVRMGCDPYGFIGRFQGFQRRDMDLAALAESIYGSPSRTGRPETR